MTKGRKTSSSGSKIKRSKGRNSNRKLHPREIMLIQRLWFRGWSDYQIWKEYRIPIPVIQDAKKQIERQAVEEFSNKDLDAVELAKLKDILKSGIDHMDAIAKDRKATIAQKLQAEQVKLQAIANLKDVIVASINSPDPTSAGKKIIEQTRQQKRSGGQERVEKKKKNKKSRVLR